MSLEFYYDETFSVASNLDPVDTFVADGTADYDLVQKSGTSMASTITAGNLQYYQFTGGFTKSGNTFTLSSTPSIGTQIVAPGIIALVFSVYDQSVVDGVSNPRVSEIPFYLGDPTQIHFYTYTSLPQYTGIRITFVDLVTSAGAELSWVQLACSSPTTGLAMTYAATGESLLTSALQTFGVLTASSAAGASSISVTASLTTPASGFVHVVGDYLLINPGDPTEEIRKIKEVTSTKIGFFTNLDYPHYINEDVYDMGRKFWAKVTVPENVANNQAFNFWDLGLRRQARNDSKV